MHTFMVHGIQIKLSELKSVEVGGSQLYTRQQKQVGQIELGGSQSQESKVLCSVHVYYPDSNNKQVLFAENLLFICYELDDILGTGDDKDEYNTVLPLDNAFPQSRAIDVSR